ncbi:hypothetical Protein YC6258_00338 [Gynuella sunshinyii YC6258]|uniref:Uncharacterized protein n=1 Tax=Gynuella sunshinyii YC6258 TaxID=1445510 RepID=A0A0C5VG52_9GAMM|nr:hypothetical Protein YC6258_00338 [Gynuella sunshinyii YC6258]
MIKGMPRPMASLINMFMMDRLWIIVVLQVDNTNLLAWCPSNMS